MCTIRVKAVAVADPAGQRFGRGDGRDPRDAAQQGDLSDERARRRLSDCHHAVGADVFDLGTTRRDQQERNSLVALLHQHLAGGGAKGRNAGRQWHQVLGGASFGDVHGREFFCSRAGQFRHCDIPSAGPATRGDLTALP